MTSEKLQNPEGSGHLLESEVLFLNSSLQGPKLGDRVSKQAGQAVQPTCTALGVALADLAGSWPLLWVAGPGTASSADIVHFLLSCGSQLPGLFLQGTSPDFCDQVRSPHRSPSWVPLLAFPHFVINVCELRQFLELRRGCQCVVSEQTTDADNRARTKGSNPPGPPGQPR